MWWIRRCPLSLMEAYKAYQTSLGLNRDGFGPITPENMEEYLVQYYLIPSANRYLSALSAEEIAAYTAKTPGSPGTAKPHPSPSGTLLPIVQNEGPSGLRRLRDDYGGTH